MQPEDFRPETIPIRDDLAQSIERTWRHIAAPGTWWTGAERVKIAAEVRAAPDCRLCAARKAALSPYTVDGAHDAASDLPAAVVEVAHRVRTDSGRLTRRWFEGVLAAGLSDAEYVEIIGIVATMAGLDTFARAMGLPRTALPAPIAGEPSRERPAKARLEIAWVPTLAPADIAPGDVDPFVYGGVNIQRAMSLVPDSVLGFFDIDTALYLHQTAIRDFENEYRAISHAQLELIAARASALNGCYY